MLSPGAGDCASVAHPRVLEVIGVAVKILSNDVHTTVEDSSGFATRERERGPVSGPGPDFVAPAVRAIAVDDEERLKRAAQPGVAQLDGWAVDPDL